MRLFVSLLVLLAFLGSASMSMAVGAFECTGQCVGCISTDPAMPTTDADGTCMSCVGNSIVPDTQQLGSHSIPAVVPALCETAYVSWLDGPDPFPPKTI